MNALLVVLLGAISLPASEGVAFDWSTIGLGQPNVPNAPAMLAESSQDYGQLTLDIASHTRTPLRIGGKTYQEGLGSHANSRIVFQLNKPFAAFVADAGLDKNDDTQRGSVDGKGSVVFVVKGDGRELVKTPVCRYGDAPKHIEVALNHVAQLELIITDAGDGISFDQADWADARLIDADGKSVPLGTIVRATQSSPFTLQSTLPASFVYGGQPSAALLKGWTRTDKPAVETKTSRVHEISWRAPNEELVATWRVEAFKDRPAAEFRWIFENAGQKPAKPLTDVFALDLTAVGAARARLVRSSGGLTGPFTNGEPAAFLVSESDLKSPITLSAAGGRSSNKDLPFFILHDDASQTGVYVGIGWSGQWQADFRPTGSGSAIRITAGMPGMNLALPAGAKIVSPNILLGSYRGDSAAGGNALRRTVYDRYVALLNGKKPLPPVSWNHWFTFENNISESMLKKQMDAAAGLGLEYFCIDSGWFIGGFPTGVGNWTLDRAKFPNGLGPVGKYAGEKGMKLGLWFEIGRADLGTRLQREHPEWVVGNQVKLEIPEARQWLFEMMCGFIDEGNVRWIRYDYNFDPLGEWDRRDKPDTRGLTQIRYLEGEYELFDRLRQRYPDLLIESCASGGRRIDLETIRRAHTFWKSDETGNLIAARSQETGASRFLPGVLLNTNLPASCKPTRFELHSLFAGPLGFASDWTKVDAEAKARIRTEIAAYKKVRHLLDKDYYPLFPQTFELSQWVGWEFNDPTSGESLVVVLRPGESVYKTAEVRLRGLDASKTYTMSRLDGSDARSVSGQELQNGLTVSLTGGDSGAWRVVRQ
jgi:alpha-galactosidase